MEPSGKQSRLAAFQVRSFRFQWPADLLTTLSFEMSTLILGWYILVETNSVIMLTVFGSLQFIGTLIAPFLGVLGDRLSRRTMLVAMRMCFAGFAAVIMVLGLTDLLTPVLVFAVAFLDGLLRPSDLVMRNALVADTMPAPRLANALGLSRTTMDSSRIFGALAGAGLFSALGLDVAFMFVTATFVIGLLLTLGVDHIGPRIKEAGEATTSYGHELKEGFVYIWNTPAVLAIMWLAFLSNLTAFPFTHGLLPFVAKEVYAVDENGLGQIVAAFSFGAVVGSLIVAWVRRLENRARMMLINLVLWYVMLAVFAFTGTQPTGMVVLFVVGIFHSIAMVSMSVTLLGLLEGPLRGRVMGVRILAIYGIPPGLMIGGFLIEQIGFTAMAMIYVAVGILFTVLIGWKWRAVLWRPSRS